MTIAGLDPSGGAGIAADLRSFARAKVWGAAVCAAITVQSTRGLVKVVPVKRALVMAQALEVLGDLDVRAVKTGALGSAENAKAAIAIAERAKALLVVDPVMRATLERGRRVKLDAGLRAMRELAARATIVTPNLAEAEALTGVRVVDDESARRAGEVLVANGARAALVKGGHASGEMAIDWFVTNARAVAIAKPRRTMPDVHGTGCTLASLVAGKLAAMPERSSSDEDLLRAVRWARARLDRALANPLAPGGGQLVLSVL